MRLAVQHRRWLAELLCGLGLCVAPVQSATAQPEPPSRAAEASFLLKFIPFVDWPDGAAKERGVTVCVTGDNPFGGLLAQVAARQPPGSPPVTVRLVSKDEPPTECQILFLGGTAEDAAALAATEGRPVLTVTDAAARMTGQGVINFIPGRDGVQFEIDMRKAAERHLDISSKLLQIAAGVRAPE